MANEFEDLIPKTSQPAKSQQNEFADLIPGQSNARPETYQSFRAIPEKSLFTEGKELVLDTAIGLGQGLTGLVKGITDNYKAGDNPVSNFLGDAIAFGDKHISNDLRGARSQRQYMIDRAARIGNEGAATRVATKTIFENPIAGIDVAAKGTGSVVPMVAAGLAGVGPGILGLIGALSNGGDAASQAAEQLKAMPEEAWMQLPEYRTLIEQGTTPVDAKRKMAPGMAIPAQAVGFGTGMISGRTGLEKVVTKQATQVGLNAALGRVGAELAGEQLESIAPLVAANATTRQYDGTTALNKGLGQTVVDTAIGSAPGAALSARHTPPPQQQPAQPANVAAPDTAALSDAISSTAVIENRQPQAAQTQIGQDNEFADLIPKHPQTDQEPAPAGAVAPVQSSREVRNLNFDRYGYTPEEWAAMSDEQRRDTEAALRIIQKDRNGLATTGNSDADWRETMDYRNEIAADVAAGRVVMPKSGFRVPVQNRSQTGYAPGVLEQEWQEAIEWAEGDEAAARQAIADEIAEGRFISEAPGRGNIYWLDLLDYVNKKQGQPSVDLEGIRRDARAMRDAGVSSDQDGISRAESAPAKLLEQFSESAPQPTEATATQAAAMPAPAAIGERAMQIEVPTPGLRPGDIVTADGKPFPNKSAAGPAAKDAGKGWRVVKGGGGFVVRYRAASEKQLANASRLVKQQSTVDTQSDSLHMAIAKLGGINFDQLTKEWGYDPAEIRTLRHGIKRIGTKNGMSLDRAGELLAELGYLSRDQHGKHDLSELFDLFDGELRGDPHYTPQGFERKMEGIKEAEYQAWLEQQDKDALNAQTDEQQEAIETFLDEYNDISPEEEARIEREAIQADSLGTLVRPDEESDSRTEEGINRAFAEVDQTTPGASGTRERAADFAERAEDLSEGDTSVNGTRAEQRRDAYTVDMFGAGLHGAEGRTVPQSPREDRTEDLDTADPVPRGSRFASRTKLVTENTRRLGISQVNSIKDAAEAMSYLGRGAVERLDALITDADGKPLAIVGAFKGALTQASVFPSTIAGEAFRVKGAANIWFAHNHPSGTADLSAADKRMFETLHSVFDGSAIKARGLFAIAGNVENVRDWEFTDGDNIHNGTAISTDSTATVPVVEREYAQTGTLGSAINSPSAAKKLAVDIAGGDAGIVLLDVRLRPLAFVPIDVTAPLRQDGRMDAIYRAISLANSGQALIVNNGKHTEEGIRNLAGLLNSVDNRVIDVIDTSTGQPKSWAEQGRDFGGTTFYSRGAGAGMTVDQVRTAIADDIFGHDVDVYDTMDDAPEYIRIQADAEGGNEVEGFWDLAKNKVALIASNIDSPQRAREVARHELIGHYGLENMLADSADPGEMSRLVKRVLKAERDGNKIILDLAAQVDRSQPNLDNERRAKEVIAIMAERNIQNSITARVLHAIRKFLKKIGFLKSDIADADIAKVLRDAQTYLREQGRAMLAGEPAPAFSRSAMKSVEANIERGRQALNRALLNKTSVHRAMFRNGLGWVDFVWGSEGTVTQSGKTKGAMGLSHIIEARMRKDGRTFSEAVQVLRGVVDTIARGNETSRKEIDGTVRIGIDDGRHIAWLVKSPQGNAWVVTGYEKTPDGKAAGRATAKPTENAASLTRDGSGAGVKNSVAQPSDNDATFSRAFHGSPHRFDKFSLDKIGTGEGHQAFGWGLYFTDKREIAEHYRKILTAQSGPAQDVANQWLNQAGGDKDQAVSMLKDFVGYDERGPFALTQERREEIHEIIALIRKGKGQLYEVEIPEDHEYLLWDKPLNEQSEHVKAAIAKIDLNNITSELKRRGELGGYTNDEIQELQGEDLYDMLRQFHDDDQRSASALLANAGIAGIKYLDGTSRGAGEGTFNYVVFDDARVSIEKAYYSRKSANDGQGDLDLKRDAIRARDFVSTNRDVSGRRRWVAGQKAYDRLTDAINPILAKVKLSNDAPVAFKQMMRQFQVDQQKALENAKRVAEVGTETLTPEERVLISDIIEKNLIGDIPPENVAKIATDISAALKQQAQELVELGMASPERLIENYLPRAYRNPLLARLTNKEMFVSWYQKAKLRMNGNRLKSRGLVDTVDMKDIEKYQKLGWSLSSMADGTDIPSDLWDAIQTGGKVPPQYAKDMQLLMWRDFTEDERAKMGEIRDGILRYAMGYTETQRDIAIGRLFKAIADNDELSSAINPGGWARVPDQEIPGTGGLKRYGALSGLYVPTYIRDVIERSTQPKGPLMQMYDKALSFWKEGKTVWNPVSHGNNIVSNVFVMHFAGLNPADPRHWRGTVREYRTKGQYYQEAIDNGLFGTEFASKEIQELFMPDLKDELDIETVVASRFNKVAESLKKVGKPVAWYRDRMQKAYEFEDQFFKLMIFMDRRKNGASIEEAIADTERYIFNYSDIPEGVEVAKRIYSPFISYTYKALPMLVHTAMTRPDRLLLPIMLLGGANWLAYAITGGDEEEERKGMPEYLQGRSAIGTPKAIRMPFNIEDRPAFMDISRRVPLGDLFDLSNQTGGLAVPAPLMPSHPLFTATAAMLFNIDTFTGREVTQKSDTGWESAQKRADWAWKQMAPNAPFVPGSWNWSKLMNGAANAFDTEMMGYTGYTKAGDPIPLSTALLDVSTGTKIRSFDPERGIDFKQYQLDKERKEIDANIRSAMRNKSMTPESRQGYINKQNEKKKALQQRREELR